MALIDTHAEVFWKNWDLVGTPACNEQAFAKAADALWRHYSTAEAGGPTKPTPTVEIGRHVLTDNDRWKLQAALRREETKIGGREYNKKVTRATKTAKAPTPGEGFPPGRGRPPR